MRPETNPRDNEPPFEEGECPPELTSNVPEPVLFLGLKHHMRDIRRHIREHLAQGESGFVALREKMRHLGKRITDLYLGTLEPESIAEQLLEQLRGHSRLERQAYQDWIEQQSGYAIAQVSDGSSWCLRWGRLPGRHVHIHPGRNSPLTLRVRATLLKTTIATLALAEYEGRDPMSLHVVNDARRRILELGPVQAIAPGEGLGMVLRAMLEVE